MALISGKHFICFALSSDETSFDGRTRMPLDLFQSLPVYKSGDWVGVLVDMHREPDLFCLGCVIHFANCFFLFSFLTSWSLRVSLYYCYASTINILLID